MKTLSFIIVMLVLQGCHSTSLDIQLFERMSNDVIAPGYSELHQQALLLSQQTSQCSSSSNNLAQYKIHWQATMSAWQSIQWVKFGPNTEQSKEWQLQFWPDQKNIIGRKLKRLLRAPTMTLDTLNTAGVIAQGLPSIEYILYDPKGQQLADITRRCQLLQMLAKQLEKTAYSLNQDWLSYANEQKTLLSKQEDNTNIALALIVNSVVQQIDKMVDRKLAAPLGLTQRNDRINLYFLESWRSGTSFNHLHTNVNSLTLLFHQGGVKDFLIARDKMPLALQIEDKLNSLKQFEVLDVSMFQGDKLALKKAVEPFYSVLAELRRLIKVDMVNALNVRLSFNSSDGDA